MAQCIAFNLKCLDASHLSFCTNFQFLTKSITTLKSRALGLSNRFLTYIMTMMNLVFCSLVQLECFLEVSTC